MAFCDPGYVWPIGPNSIGDHPYILRNADLIATMRNKVQTSGTPPQLENLPAELRNRLLSNMPDLRTLGALVRASPVYFAQYRLSRKSLLTQVLQAELGDELLVDVYAAFKSAWSQIGPPNKPNSNLSDFLRLYRGWRSPDGERPTPDMFSLDELRWMAWFYSSTVRPLAARFVASAFSYSSARSASLLSNTSHRDTSRTEKTRLLRAFYRFETFGHLFGGSHCEHSATRHSNLPQLFFSMFDPWEVEEIGCVYTFIKDRFKEIIIQVHYDFDQSNARFRRYGYLVNYHRPFDLYADFEEFWAGTIAYGGLRLAFYMFKIETHNALVDLMIHSLTPISHAFFEEALSARAQRDRRRSTHPDDRDRAEEGRDALMFTGDDSARPPLAWVLLWNGKYSNLYGEYMPKKLRRQGYVMWDEQRLADKGLKEYFIRLWAESPELERVQADWPVWN